MFQSSLPQDGPLIRGTVSVQSNSRYDLTIEILRTDTGDSSEYADIILDGNSLGKCNPDGDDGDCTWYTCSNLLSKEIRTTSNEVDIKIQFSSGVKVGIYPCNGDKNVAARVTLAPKGNIAQSLTLIF